MRHHADPLSTDRVHPDPPVTRREVLDPPAIVTILVSGGCLSMAGGLALSFLTGTPEGLVLVLVALAGSLPSLALAAFLTVPGLPFGAVRHLDRRAPDRVERALLDQDAQARIQRTLAAWAARWMAEPDQADLLALMRELNSTTGIPAGAASGTMTSTPGAATLDGMAVVVVAHPETTGVDLIVHTSVLGRRQTITDTRLTAALRRVLAPEIVALAAHAQPRGLRFVLCTLSGQRHMRSLTILVGSVPAEPLTGHALLACLDTPEGQAVAEAWAAQT